MLQFSNLLTNPQDNLLQANLDAQKQGKKKKGRKPVIHLVTKDPMSSSPEDDSSTETYKIGTQDKNPMRLE